MKLNIPLRLYSGFPCRPPCGGRGLKFETQEPVDQTIIVAPRVGGVG